MVRIALQIKFLKRLKHFFKERNIPLKNIVAMANDTHDYNNSFFSYLKSEIVGLVFLNCICHSSAITASKACEKFPQSSENLIRSYLHFRQCKKMQFLGEFQDFLNVEQKNS